MAPETLLLVVRAEMARTESLRLNREMAETLRLSWRLMAVAVEEETALCGAMVELIARAGLRGPKPTP